MIILITGGFGYIGGRLAKYLGELYGDHSIRLLIRNDSYVPDWVGDKKLIRGDLLDIHSLEHACKDVDVILHLAALNEIDSAKDPVAALKVNGEGTLNLINAAVKNNVKKVIYFSTFHVYGLNASGEITENRVPLPVHPYSITHHVSEDFIRMAHYKKNINGTILRLSNGFGYPAHPEVNRWSLVVNDLCLQAVLNNKMILKSSGKQHRDFITLTDVSRCIEHLLSLGDMGTDASDCVYNLGGEFSSSILDIAKLIKERCNEVLGTNPEIIVGTDSVSNSVLEQPVRYNIDKIKKTGFRLISNVTEEIDETIHFCEQYKDILKCNLQ
ncbi:NAD(P)-dependent oxidoreductase [uncultured Methanomethylovorans sp.]|uniref:NAD-dependent epimerase/dehydratase family protein n=1 Tax=uncultured Methanomethylovorans sp. TaxID=183759 RepID=UPI002AA79DC2|nr:NAD(P)-dependent oxidoreductase [uncultured Methanomethylovorans sp.]